MFNKDITIKANNVTSYEYNDGNRYATITGIVDLYNLNKEQTNGILPKKYIINDNATILFWDDGTKTVVKREKGDEYNKILGFLWAYFQKNSGLSKTKANKYIKGLLDEDEIKALEILKDTNISELFGDIAAGISKCFENLSKSFRNNINNTNITVPNLLDKNDKKYMK